MFEAPRKPELTETQKTLAKKREELARVQERLQAPDLRPGLARELRKHVTTARPGNVRQRSLKGAEA